MAIGHQARPEWVTETLDHVRWQGQMGPNGPRHGAPSRDTICLTTTLASDERSPRPWAWRDRRPGTPERSSSMIKRLTLFLVSLIVSLVISAVVTWVAYL